MLYQTFNCKYNSCSKEWKYVNKFNNEKKKKKKKKKIIIILLKI